MDTRRRLSKCHSGRIYFQNKFAPFYLAPPFYCRALERQSAKTPATFNPPLSSQRRGLSRKRALDSNHFTSPISLDARPGTR